jgi:uncharacterized protein YyaL (SSP411 family)
MNRLANETSPYLQQHAHNPVDWYPWGEEALARARAEDKPILLSIGYSACHWCHVMAHESFEHEETAELMNRWFINIKVDREERPDIDDIYMQAVQALSNGRGGWPLTVFLLPDGRPFYGGTYFPLEPRYGMPSFRQILQGVRSAFDNRRAEVERVASELTSALSRGLLNAAPPDALNAGLLEAAAKRLLRDFDPVHGGFGGAPKFPQPMNLEFLLHEHHRSGQRDALEAVTLTLKKMARGGIYDQIGGGFHRYSVDAVWLVPHFEKMLYDNAQLSRVYLHAWQITGDAFFRRIAEEIDDYIIREMTAPEGGFYSATDADSEGEEGKFFVWSPDELAEQLGPDARIAIEYWGVTPRGNFEGHNILFVPNDEAVVAQRLGLSTAELQAKIELIRDTLYAARTRREPPGLDDKILAGWNGLMLASLAEAARVLDRPRYLEAAVHAGEFLRDHMITYDGRVFRTWKAGMARVKGFLEDYAALADAFLELYQTTFDVQWFTLARRLIDRALELFRAEDGGFHDTSPDHEALISRPRSLQDNAVPAGSSLMARALIRLAAYTGEARYDEAARASLSLLVNAMREYPQAFGEALNAVALLVSGINEVALIGPPDSAELRALLAVLRQPYRPAQVVACAPQPDDAHPIPLLRGRTLLDGQPTAYVCRQFACQLPVTTPEALAAQLGGAGAQARM